VNGEESATVNPKERVTVEMTVRSYGTVPATDIQLKNKMTVYDIYYDYIEGSAQVTLNGTSVSGFTAALAGDEVVIDMPSTLSLRSTDVLVVSFEIEILELIRGTDFPTLFKFIENQAVVEYSSGLYKQITGLRRSNASREQKISIADIKLEKEIIAVNGDEDFDGVPIAEKGDTFTVRLTITDESGLETEGIISDTLPRGFTVVSAGPDASVMTVGDYERIVIFYDSLDPAHTGGTFEFEYVMQYNGDEFGVTYAGLLSEYKFSFASEMTHSNNANLQFLEPLLGIRAHAEDDVFDVVNAAMLDLTRNANIHSWLPDAQVAISTHELIFYTNDSGTTELDVTEVDGVLTINADGFYAQLLWIDDRNMLSFEALEAGEYTLFYRIRAVDADETIDLSSNVATITINATVTP
jgi:hypothetical protein